ncbi:hypothetical protein PQO03_12150 [Lentisphaera profundi]|uniref:Uncharacterized protein n=1 Tax=Lentisphaera profundi TaxID=1658616 RepID=A0ABY7W0S7_9BACT|nr:hypothetical protein [Lentisphaera profundi]WDE98589.1 hypothetical protein PQO03_12150 [Lentisphaera profundi]
MKSEVFEGNVGEPSTLKEILSSCGLLEEKQDELPFRPISAMDRGIATKENIVLIKELHFPYTVIQRANKTPKFKDEFTQLDGFKQISDAKGQTIHLKKSAIKFFAAVKRVKRKKKLCVSKKLSAQAKT